MLPGSGAASGSAPVCGKSAGMAGSAAPSGSILLAGSAALFSRATSSPGWAAAGGVLAVTCAVSFSPLLRGLRSLTGALLLALLLVWAGALTAGAAGWRALACSRLRANPSPERAGGLAACGAAAVDGIRAEMSMKPLYALRSGEGAVGSAFWRRRALSSSLMRCSRRLASRSAVCWRRSTSVS